MSRTQTASDDSWLDLDAAAAHTRRSRRSLELLITRGELPAYKLGRSTRVKRSDVDALLIPVEAASADPELEDFVRRTLAQAPELSAEQRARIARLLLPAHAAPEGGDA